MRNGIYTILSTEKTLGLIQWMESKGFEFTQAIVDGKSLAELILEEYNKGC